MHWPISLLKTMTPTITWNECAALPFFGHDVVFFFLIEMIVNVLHRISLAYSIWVRYNCLRNRFLIDSYLMIETLNQQISPTQKPIFLHTISNNDWSIDFNFLLLHTQKKTKKTYTRWEKKWVSTLSTAQYGGCQATKIRADYLTIEWIWLCDDARKCAQQLEESTLSIITEALFQWRTIRQYSTPLYA